MRIICLGMLVVALGVAASGCSQQAVYAALQTRQRNQCLELDDAQQRSCSAAAETSWSDYDRERTAAR
jgi:hypothetical protein